MKSILSYASLLALGSLSLVLSSCAYTTGSDGHKARQSQGSSVKKSPPNYAARMPKHINVREKVVVVDPSVHAWGAYDANGNLLRAGLATAGANWCADIGRSCRTSVGSFRVNSLGTANCKSSRYPRPKGGAPMPYCMFFNGHQGLHGSYNVVDGNASHGCVRLQVDDASWLRHHFVKVGTKVVIKPYR